MAHIPAERCLSIVELLAQEADELPLGVIAEQLRLPKSGVHRLLATLAEQGWVEQGPAGGYRLTLRLAILGQRHFALTGIPDVCQPVLDGLARRTREFVRMAVVDSQSLVWVADAQGAPGGLMYQPILTTNTVPLYATASGKAWLATVGRERALEIFMANGAFEGADAYGPNVVRSLDALLHELDRTAQRGYGLAAGEAEPGVSAVAAAICSGDRGAVVGTISVAGPTARMTEHRIKDIAVAVMATAKSLSELWDLHGTRPRPARNAEAA